MGNEQSNENTRKRIVRVKPKCKKDAVFFEGEVVRKETYESFIRFYLDNYLVYKDGNYKYIDLANCSSFDDSSIEYCLGRSLDMNYIRNYNHTKTFGKDECFDLFGMTKPIIGWEDSERNFRDSSGNIISDTLELVASVGETIEENQKYAAWIEYGRSMDVMQIIMREQNRLLGICLLVENKIIS